MIIFTVTPEVAVSTSCSGVCIGVLVSLSVVVIVILSNVCTVLVTCHCIKKRRSDLQQTSMPTGQAVYEDLTNVQPEMKEFKMDDNLAYGPLR